MGRINADTRFFRTVAIAAVGLLASACTIGPYNAESLNDLPPVDSAFQIALSQGYADLGDAERGEYDWVDAARFYRRAITAARDQEVDPEPVDQRDLTPDDTVVFTTARAELMVVLADGARVLAAGDAAQAQAAFDCWIQEAEEGHQTDHIAECRERFLAALDRARGALNADLIVLLTDLDGGVGRVQVQTDGGSADLSTARAGLVVTASGEQPRTTGVLAERDVLSVFGDALSAQPPAPIVFLLYFRQGTNELTVESAGKLPDVLAAIEDRVAPRIDIAGHTDTAGSVALNDRLALSRARLVLQAVLDLGIEPDVVSVDSFGERDPLVPTGDGVDEPRNRRVEIVIR